MKSTSHQTRPRAKSTNQKALLWSLFTNRPQNQYHQYQKPAVLKPKPAGPIHQSHGHHKHHRRQTFYNVDVKFLDGHQDTYQLDKDLTHMLNQASKSSNQPKYYMNQYFEQALIVVPTKPYPNPSLSVAKIKNIHKTHQYSPHRTRSQFLRLENYKIYEFLMHNYDAVTQTRIKNEAQTWYHRYQRNEIIATSLLLLLVIAAYALCAIFHIRPIPIIL